MANNKTAIPTNEGMEHHSHFPRVYLIRHGETEWSLNGRHTGTTDIPLTQRGEDVMRKLGPLIVGKNKLLDPRHLSLVLVSPRTRAKRTFELLFEPLLDEKTKRVTKEREERENDGQQNEEEDGHSQEPSSLHPLHPNSHLNPLITSEDVREWDYGEFEGRKSKDIRKDKGLENWNMWVDGCPGGESPEQIAERADRVVEQVREIHRRALAAREKKIEESGYAGTTAPSELACDRGVGDVLIFSHGHFLRVFLARWIGLPSSAGVGWVLDAGGVSVGGYEHGRIQEPAILALNNYAMQ